MWWWAHSQCLCSSFLSKASQMLTLFVQYINYFQMVTVAHEWRTRPHCSQLPATHTHNNLRSRHVLCRGDMMNWWSSGVSASPAAAPQTMPCHNKAVKKLSLKIWIQMEIKRHHEGILTTMFIIKTIRRKCETTSGWVWVQQWKKENIQIKLNNLKRAEKEKSWRNFQSL